MKNRPPIDYEDMQDDPNDMTGLEYDPLMEASVALAAWVAMAVVGWLVTFSWHGALASTMGFAVAWVAQARRRSRG